MQSIDRIQNGFSRLVESSDEDIDNLEKLVQKECWKRRVIQQEETSGWRGIMKLVDDVLHAQLKQDVIALVPHQKFRGQSPINGMLLDDLFGKEELWTPFSPYPGVSEGRDTTTGAQATLSQPRVQNQ